MAMAMSARIEDHGRKEKGGKAGSRNRNAAVERSIGTVAGPYIRVGIDTTTKDRLRSRTGLRGTYGNAPHGREQHTQSR